MLIVTKATPKPQMIDDTLFSKCPSEDVIDLTLMMLSYDKIGEFDQFYQFLYVLTCQTDHISGQNSSQSHESATETTCKLDVRGALLPFYT